MYPALQAAPGNAACAEQLRQFWEQQKLEVSNVGNDPAEFKNHQLPLARIKKIMKSDEDVRMISAEAPVLFAKACEMFILELTLRSWLHADENKRRTLQRSDIAAAIMRTDILDFLVDIVPNEEAKQEGGGMEGAPSSSAAAAPPAPGALAAAAAAQPVAAAPAPPPGLYPPLGFPLGSIPRAIPVTPGPSGLQIDAATAALLVQQQQQQQQQQLAAAGAAAGGVPWAAAPALVVSQALPASAAAAQAAAGAGDALQLGVAVVPADAPGAPGAGDAAA